MRRIAEGDASQRRHHSKLRHDDPSSPSPKEAAEDGRIVAVEKGRPDEFELVGEGELAHQADGRDWHLGFVEPGRLRDVDELKGNARRETEDQHRRDAPVREEVAQEGRLLSALRARILHVDPRPRGESNRVASGSGLIAEAGLRSGGPVANLSAQYRLYRIIALSGMDRVERTNQRVPPICSKGRLTCPLLRLSSPAPNGPR